MEHVNHDHDHDHNFTESDTEIAADCLGRAYSVMTGTSGSTYYLHKVSGTMAIYSRYEEDGVTQAYLLYWGVESVEDFGTHVDNLDEEARVLMADFELNG